MSFIENENDDRPWTDIDVMKFLEVSRPTLYNLRRYEGLPAHKLRPGKASPVRYFRDEIEAWLRNRCSSGTPGQAA